MYHAEVMAIYMAAYEANCILQNTDVYIKLFSDSQVALKSLNKYKLTSKTVVKAAEALNTLGQDRGRLELNWIKAHNNYTGNERADELARNAVYHNVVNFNIDPPFTEIKNKLNAALTDVWNEEWRLEETCRMSKNFYPTLHKGKAKQLCIMTRDKTRRLVEIVTGQNNLHYIKNKIKGKENLCRLCEEEEEIFDHFVDDCPCLWQTRQDYFRTTAVVNTHDWKIDNLLRFSETPAINEALEDT